MTYIRELLPTAADRLITIEQSDTVVKAAGLLGNANTALVIVCDPEGLICGVISKADIVRQISYCTGCSCTENVSDIMTRDVIACRPDDRLKDVWTIMREHGLKQIPVQDTAMRPLGLLYASDALETLLKEVKHQELMLRDYVMGTGYR